MQETGVDKVEVLLRGGEIRQNIRILFRLLGRQSVIGAIGSARTHRLSGFE